MIDPTQFDPTQLVVPLFTFLLPHLEYIRGKVAESALSESGKALVTLVKDKWLSKAPAAAAVADELVAKRDDPDNHEAFQLQLKKALKDPTFAEEVRKLLEKEPKLLQAAGDTQNVTGDNNKTVFNKGDGNTIKIS